MEQTDFARIFVCDGLQLLVYWEPEGEESSLHQIINTPGGQLDAKLTFPGEDDAAQAFAAYDQAKADAVYASLLTLAKGFNA